MLASIYAVISILPFTPVAPLFDELTEKGITSDIKQIEADIIERDHRDMTRENSPLKQADDAVLIDSSDMTIEEVKNAILAEAKGRL